MTAKAKVIFFDLFGVLLGVDQSVAIHYISKATDTPYLQTREIVQGEIFMELQRGEIDFSTYIEKLKAAMPNGKLIDADELHQVWMNSNTGEMPAVSLLHSLQKICSVWVISNTTEHHINQLAARFQFLTDLDGIISSEKAGVRKPNPAIFQYALSLASVEAHEACFIDDSRQNVASAENLGFLGHHYTGFEFLLSFLNKCVTPINLEGKIN